MGTEDAVKALEEARREAIEKVVQISELLSYIALREKIGKEIAHALERQSKQKQNQQSNEK